MPPFLRMGPSSLIAGSVQCSSATVTRAVKVCRKSVSFTGNVYVLLGFLSVSRRHAKHMNSGNHRTDSNRATIGMLIQCHDGCH